jgi:hypothetical protein
VRVDAVVHPALQWRLRGRRLNSASSRSHVTNINGQIVAMETTFSNSTSKGLAIANCTVQVYHLGLTIEGA